MPEKNKKSRFLAGGFLILGILIGLLVFKGDQFSGLFRTKINGGGKLNDLATKVKLADLSLPFVANSGQWDSRIKLRANLFTGDFLITDQELVYSLMEGSERNQSDFFSVKKPASIQPESFIRLGKAKKNTGQRRIIIKESFLSQNELPVTFQVGGQEKSPTKISYFKGNNPGNWKIDLSSFKTVSLGSVYPGIEVRLRASGQNVEKIFYLKPGARVGDIRIQVEGVDSLNLNERGELILNTGRGQLAMMRPAGYQEFGKQQEKVEVAYELKGQNEYGFKIVGPYDPESTIVIDPALSTLSASTYLGGTGNDRAFCLSADNQGHIYVAGYTLSSAGDFPTTAGAYDRTYNGQYDIFVSRLSNDLSTLEASTFIGGKGSDYVNGLVLDSFGNVYLAGFTNSTDFPVLAGAFQNSYRGGDYDSFVLKLSPALDNLLASTYLGGSGTDYGASLILDSSYNVYVTGTTDSSDFPVTPGAFSTIYRGGYDAFIAKLSNSLDSLIASTFIGGSDYDVGSAMAIGNPLIAGSPNLPSSTSLPNQSSGLKKAVANKINSWKSKSLDESSSGSNKSSSNSPKTLGTQPGSAINIQNNEAETIYLAGRTKSSDFPTTAGAYDQQYHGNYDGFVIWMTSDLRQLLASTYIGGTGDDFLYCLAPDHRGNIFVSGYTASTDYPTTSGAYSASSKGKYDIFVSRLNGPLSYLLASTYIGGSDDDFCRAMVVDPYDNVYLTGWTKSTDYPTTSGAYKGIDQGGLEVMVTKVSASLQALLASTYIGGGGDDLAYALALDNSGNLYVTGYTSSSTFPMTENPYQKSISGTDAFIAKFGAVDHYLLSVNRLGSGQVISSDGGINCNSECSQVYDAGTVVTLKAIPDTNYIFGGWSGDVYSTSPTISITMDSDKAVTAKFAPEGATYTLTILKSGSGSGTVTSDDGAINCGSVCSQTYTSGTLINLTATPDANSGFENWSGDIYATTPTVPVIINGDMTIIAVFGPPPLPDLTGEWHDLKITKFLGRTTIINGFFNLKNIGEGQANSGFQVSYYLSSNGISLDIPLNSRTIVVALPGGTNRDLMFARYVPGSVNVSGKYLIAVIDPDNLVVENNKSNNRVVYGPLQ
ncbi:MAG: SBBP repeat-containing protein [Candidatus Saccharicenans sp.]